MALKLSLFIKTVYYTPPSLSSTETKWSGDTLPTYIPISGVGAYTVWFLQTIILDQPGTAGPQ